jgi:hypothetical protein
MSVSNHASPSPKFTSSAPSGPANVRNRLARIASELAVELGRPAAELAAGRLTMAGVQNIRRQAAARVLPAIDVERANVEHLEAEVAEAQRSQDRAVASAEAALPPSTIGRAQATASLFNARGGTTEGDVQARGRFAKDVHDGVRDAVLGALFLSPYGQMAELHEVAHRKFAESVIPATKLAELRGLDVATKLVRMEAEDLHAAVAAVAKTGDDEPLTGAELLQRANDATRNGLIQTGRELGIIEAPTVSNGTAKGDQIDRLATVGAAAASNRGAAATGGR